MPAFLALIAGAVGRFLTDKLSFYLAIKLLIITLFVTILPIVLKNVITWLASTVYSAVMSAIGGYTFQAQIIQFTGASAYIADQLQLPLCISIILSALSLRMVLNFIPFVK